MTLILLDKSPKLYVLEKFTRLYASIIKMISLIAIIDYYGVADQVF